MSTAHIIITVFTEHPRTSLIKMRDWIKNQKVEKSTKMANKTVLNFLDLLETVIHHDTIDQVLDCTRLGINNFIF